MHVVLQQNILLYFVGMLFKLPWNIKLITVCIFLNMFSFANTTTIYLYPGHGFQIIRFYHSNKFELWSTSWLSSLIAEVVEVSVRLLPTTVLFSRWFLHSQSGNMIISRIYYFQKFQIRSSLTHDHLDHTCSRWKYWQNNPLWAGTHFFLLAIIWYCQTNF